jgi:GNAT superfamily N-acetyltransferase
LTLTIRNASRADLQIIAQFIRDLAEYEKLADEVRFDEAVLGDRLFGARPYAEVLIGEIDGHPQGFALFFHNFSTFEGKPGVYLEDLFVRPEARGSGLGRALLAALAQIAVERDCARLEWWVLDWNDPAIQLLQRPWTNGRRSVSTAMHCGHWREKFDVYSHARFTVIANRGAHQHARPCGKRRARPAHRLFCGPQCPGRYR